MDTKRLILFVIFSFSILMLWDAWQRQDAPAGAIPAVSQQDGDSSVPQAERTATPATDLPKETGFRLQTAGRVQVETDLFKADIDTLGGDLRRLELLQHRSVESMEKNFVLMEDTAAPMLYVAQSGLIGNDLPTHKTQFASVADSYKMQEGSDRLDVILTWTNPQGVQCRSC